MANGWHRIYCLLYCLYQYSILGGQRNDGYSCTTHKLGLSVVCFAGSAMVWVTLQNIGFGVSVLQKLGKSLDWAWFDSHYWRWRRHWESFFVLGMRMGLSQLSGVVKTDPRMGRDGMGG